MQSPFKALVLLAAFILSSGLLTGDVSGQAPDNQLVQWHRLAGTAVDININSQGQAYAVDPAGTPWRWDALEQRWRKMSGQFVRITAAEGNRPWAINAEGVVFRYNGLWWENKETGVADVAADALGNVFIAKTNGEIKKWNPLRSEWRPIEGKAARIALDSGGHPWVITGDGGIQSFDGSAWTVLPGRARDIAAGGSNTVVIADGEGLLRVWEPGPRRWRVIPGVNGVTAVAVAPDGGPWTIIQNGVIMATTLLISPEKIKTEEGSAQPVQAPSAQAAEMTVSPVVAPSAQAASVVPAPLAAPPIQAQSLAAAPQVAAAPATPSPVSVPPAPGQNAPASVAPATAVSSLIDPAAQTATGNITFINTRKTAADLAIGKDGSVFALDAGGNVLRWSNTRQRFESFPGTLARIAVDPAGNPWGVSALGRVFRHTGSQWKQIANATASDIAIGSDGTVIVSDANSRLYKLNDEMTQFSNIPGSGLFVAVAPDGVPWTIRSDNLVQRCVTSSCEILPQKATSIAIGPDGSVYVVSDQARLMRLKADGKSFEAISTQGHTPAKVAVGPNGYPWVANSDNIALASTYFVRDEGGDRTVAAATADDTSGTGATAAVVSVSTSSSFTFSKNMSFDTYSPGFSSLSELTAGENGEFYVYGDNGGQLPDKILNKFNSTTKAFENTGYSFPENVSKLDVDIDGAFWGLKGSKIYKLSSKGVLSKTYSMSGLGTARDIATSADGTVYAIFGSRMYYLKPGTSVFTKFSNDDVEKVAVGLAGDLWVLDSNFYIQQYTGSKFENRPLGQSLSANDLGAGADGTVYAAISNGSTYDLKKWNATNKSFDKINNATADMLDVDPNGRPWYAYTSSSNDVKRGKD